MNTTKGHKNQSDLSTQSKSLLLISNNYRLETLYNILRKNPSLVNKKDEKNETFLSYAIKRKNIEIAELILTSPILDYSYQDQNGNSYLHLAVINQLESIITTMIQKGINVNLQNNDGNTALHFAYNTGDIKFISIIIESKVDFTIKNKNGLIAEEVPPGTYPEILEINDGDNNSKNLNVNNNKNNLIDDNSYNTSINENEKDNNGIIINEKGQINKSIRINWENNDINNKGNNNAIKNIKKINNNNSINEIENMKNNVHDNSINISKAKLKYSLVNLSYSDNGDDEDDEENGIISQKSISKPNENNAITNINQSKKKIKSSDIFDLTSSLSYQEKVQNAYYINSHVVGETNILSKKDSNENDMNDDIVNINKVKTIESNDFYNLDNNTINNNMINNGVEISQVSFQTAYENGRNMNLSEVNIDKENGKSEDLNNENKNKENDKKLFFNESIATKKDELYDRDIQNSFKREESEGICNYNNNNTNLNQSNSCNPQPDYNNNFAFSPFTTLKEPLNKKYNGSEVIDNNNSNNISNINNNNSNNLSNINIDNELTSYNIKSPDQIYKIEYNSSNIKICNGIQENSTQNSNQIITNNLSNNKENNNINYNTKSTPTKNKTNTNLSKASQNNINAKTHSKFNFNCPINISLDTINSSTTKKPRDSLYKFLSEIKMEKYYDIFISNGFDDINFLIKQTKSGNAIKDKQLKEAGINFPGERAKILIKLQEKAGNFIFPIPKEVYYICENNNYKNDKCIKKLNDWLKALKVEDYLDNFIKNGYHSIELMLLQMESKNPLTDEILKDEIGISKIGHRARIINKLLEEARSLKNKLKTSMLIVGDVLTEKICECNIY